MIRAIIQLLSLASALVEVIASIMRRREQQQHQEQIDNVQKDPADWFDDHFNGDKPGLHNDAPNDPVASLPGDADAASQAELTKPDKDV